MNGLKDTNRRTVLKTIGASVAGGTVLTGTASADDFEYPGEQPRVADLPPVFPTWGSDGTDHWEMLDPAAPQNTDHESHRPLYHIAPSGGDHSPHFFVLDNVVDTPAVGGGDYSAVWDVSFVVDDPASFWEAIEKENIQLLLATLVSFPEPTVSKVEAAIENDSDVHEIDIPFQFVCPVRPHHHEED